MQLFWKVEGGKLYLEDENGEVVIDVEKAWGDGE